MQQTIIQPLAKGQITIPASFRKALNIQQDTLLRAKLTDRGILLEPIQLDWREKYIREFTDEEIEEWKKADVLDRKTLQKIKKYLS